MGAHVWEGQFYPVSPANSPEKWTTGSHYQPTLLAKGAQARSKDLVRVPPASFSTCARACIGVGKPLFLFSEKFLVGTVLVTDRLKNNDLTYV